ncbi:MAG: sce7726 family protein, partial [Solobacterium sp.]|nr:sce7726 family protein [Solobacterium sp.]
FNILVIGTTHAAHAEEHVPDWWGIITAEPEQGRVDLYTLRKPKPNPKCRLRNQLAILWRPELNQILKRCHLPAYREKSKKFVQEKLLEKLDAETLKRELIETLFERDYTMIEGEIEAYRKVHKKH